MKNQFNSLKACYDYLTAIEQASPVIKANAVTDYDVTNIYEEMLRYKAVGCLPSAKMVFPTWDSSLTLQKQNGDLSISTSLSALRIHNISTSCGVCYRALELSLRQITPLLAQKQSGAIDTLRSLSILREL